MPGKGTAFVKPGINQVHKAGSAKAAKVKAAAAAAEDESELSKELTARVQDSKMEDKRKTQALKHIGEALEKLRSGVDPLSGLTPPPDCRVCAGNVKGTHHFLCRKRVLEPGATERPVRTFVLNKLQKAWREQLYAAKDDSESVRAAPPAALLRSALRPPCVARAPSFPFRIFRY